MKHTTILQNGNRCQVDLVFEAHQIGVHSGTTFATRKQFVVTDLTTDHVFATASGAPLVFDTPAQACAFVGALLIARYGMSLAAALAAIQEARP